jgi:hypothetical protein
MGKILKFPSEKMRNKRSAAQAARKWEAIPPHVRTLLLNNAYCGTCKGATSVDNYRILFDADVLVIDGVCRTCGKTVKRVVD